MPEKDSKMMNEVHSSNAAPAAGDVNSSAASPPGSTVDPHNVQELTSFIQNLLQQTQDRFQGMSDQIVRRIDDMGRRIDELERNISELMTQAGVDDANN